MSNANVMKVITRHPRIRVRGLPYWAKEEDLKAFFSIGLAPQQGAKNVELIKDSSNRPTGQAIVYFKTEVDAIKAIGSHNRRYFKGSNRFVELRPDFLQ